MVDGGRVKWWEELDGCALRWIRSCRGYDVGKTSWKEVGWLRLPGYESKHIYEAGHSSLSTTAIPQPSAVS